MVHPMRASPAPSCPLCRCRPRCGRRLQVLPRSAALPLVVPRWAYDNPVQLVYVLLSLMTLVSWLARMAAVARLVRRGPTSSGVSRC